MSASTAIANPAEMSSCATSAAHDRMNAAPTIGQAEQRGLERVRQIRSRRTDHQRGHGGGDRQHERDALS